MHLHGVLKSACGPLASVHIAFLASKTTLNGVLEGSSCQFTTDEDGSYSLDIQPGYYRVYVVDRGQRRRLGNVVADADSEMTLPEALEADPTPVDPSYLEDVLAQVQAARDAAAASASSAHDSADASAQSADHSAGSAQASSSSADSAASSANSADDSAQSAASSSSSAGSSASAAFASAQSAGESATQSGNYAGIAAGHRQAAEAAQGAAEDAEANAESSSGASAASATSAEQSADQAASSANSAGSSESAASSSAASAAASASAAAQSESSATSSATSATNSASSANSSASDAAQSASSAAGSASAANSSADAALDSAASANNSAQGAASSAQSADDNAQATEQDRIATEDNRAAVESAAGQVSADAADAVASRAGAEAARDQAVAIADPESAIQAAFDIWVVDKERQDFEAATGGACTIERNAAGDACHMFILPKMNWEDLVPSGELGTGAHEAFLADGVERSELLIGMYQAARGPSGTLVSQPGLTPRRSISWDNSRVEAQAAGFDIMSNWEWSALAFWMVANGFEPRGNTSSGQSHSHRHEHGVTTEYRNTLTGTGPNTWRHNNAPNGIADLTGNLWEWVWGYKMVDGRIFMAPDNDKSLVESAWLDTGWDMPDTSSTNFAGLYDAENEAPLAVRRALIMPNGVADPGGSVWTNLSGERFPARGGARNNAGHAGPGAQNLNNERTDSDTRRGLRFTR